MCMCVLYNTKTKTIIWYEYLEEKNNHVTPANL